MTPTPPNTVVGCRTALNSPPPPPMAWGQQGQFGRFRATPPRPFALQVLLNQNINPPPPTTKDVQETGRVAANTRRVYGPYEVGQAGRLRVRLQTTDAPAPDVDPDMYVFVGQDNFDNTRYSCRGIKLGVKYCTVNAPVGAPGTNTSVWVGVYLYASGTQDVGFTMDVTHDLPDSGKPWPCDNSCPAPRPPASAPQVDFASLAHVEFMGAESWSENGQTGRTFTYVRTGASTASHVVLGTCYGEMFHSASVGASLGFDNATGLYGIRFPIVPGLLVQTYKASPLALDLPHALIQCKFLCLAQACPWE